MTLKSDSASFREKIIEQDIPTENRGGFSYKDYLQLPEDGNRYQVMNGYLFQEPAPTTLHQRVVFRLYTILSAYFAKVDPRGEVFGAPLDLKLTPHDIVQPDLLYIPGNRHSPKELSVNTLPELVVEVVSPSSKTT